MHYFSQKKVWAQLFDLEKRFKISYVYVKKKTKYISSFFSSNFEFYPYWYMYVFSHFDFMFCYMSSQLLLFHFGAFINLGSLLPTWNNRTKELLDSSFIWNSEELYSLWFLKGIQNGKRSWMAFPRKDSTICT